MVDYGMSVGKYVDKDDRVSSGQHMTKSWHGNAFRITSPMWGESTGHRRITLTNASDAELWCFRWCQPEQKAEHSREAGELMSLEAHLTSM